MKGVCAKSSLTTSLESNYPGIGPALPGTSSQGAGHP